MSSHQALCVVEVEWLPDPDPQGGEVSSGGAGRLPVGRAQHQQAGLLLVSPVPHVRCQMILGYNSTGSGPSLTLSKGRGEIDFQLSYSSNQTDNLIFTL